MIHLHKTIMLGLLALLAALLSANVMAQAENFVDEASAKGMAEIETARLALKESQDEDVRDFAQQMLDDHTKVRQDLARLAQDNDLEMSDDATLMDKAKAMILQLRDGEDFNEAYANNQVTAHQQTIELYQEYVRNGQDPALKEFAESTLPKLEEHLRMAKDLAARHGGDAASMNQ